MRDGAMATRSLDDGRELVLYPMIFNVRLCVGPEGEGTYDRAWCYKREHMSDAVVALADWDGEGDPPGRWLKEAGTERRRDVAVDLPVEYHYDNEGHRIHDA